MMAAAENLMRAIVPFLQQLFRQKVVGIDGKKRK